jgi:RNA polymerase primary sigma factor
MDNIIEKKELSIELSKALNILSERERKILKLRYGLEDCEPMTLEEIGIIFNLSKERIRQIEIKVLKKLRESNYINTLQR